MSQTLELAGWVLAVGGLAAAAAARHRMASLAEAVARTCHELRGPLAAARLGLTLAFRGGQLVDVRLKAIELELGQATLALEDLAEAWQRPTAARKPDADIRTEDVDVGQLLAESVEAWRAPAAVMNAELRLVESRERPVVRGERLRLAQAIGNLIANAIEHGGGVVEVNWRVDAETVRVEVQDEGPGLPAAVTELARRRSARWAPWSSRHYPKGDRRGHGLAVVSAVAAAHGGRLAGAACDHGARLVLELPRAGVITLRRPASD